MGSEMCIRDSNRTLVFIAAVALVLGIRFGVDAGYFLVVLVMDCMLSLQL